jgi:hypothetical protein
MEMLLGNVRPVRRTQLALSARTALRKETTRVIKFGSKET